MLKFDRLYRQPGGLAQCVLGAIVWCVGATMHPVQAQSSHGDVSLSWEKGLAYVPGSLFPVSPANVAVQGRHPVVLYMHGCNGLGQADSRWGDYLRGLGYVVVQPDSFGRSRSPSCDPRSNTVGLFPGVQSFRRQELNYAYEQIVNSAWTDPDRIFLMGHSEGGYTVSQVARSDFRGVVVSGYMCRFGLLTSRPVPVLTLNHEHDPWYPGGNGSDCADHFGLRPHAHSVVLPGSGHDTSGYEGKEAVKRFLETYATEVRPRSDD